MLSRIANSLLWMGRYLERAQHTARYMHVHYFSALDAPILSRKELFVVGSIADMTGLSYGNENREIKISEEEFLYSIALDDANPVSIKYAVVQARENARGARDILSSELWASVNKFYHHVNSYTGKTLKEEDILRFTEMVGDHCAIVNGYIDHSLVHDDTWSLIQLGKHTEAAGQLTRILISKVADYQRAEKMKLGKSIETYQCVTLLKSAEAFDMSRVHYKAVPNLKDSLEFLILNRDFPRSIIYNMNKINKCLNKIKIINGPEKGTGTPEFFAGKLNARYSFLTIEEIEGDIIQFLENTLQDLYQLGGMIEERIS